MWVKKTIKTEIVDKNKKRYYENYYYYHYRNKIK